MAIADLFCENITKTLPFFSSNLTFQNRVHCSQNTFGCIYTILCKHQEAAIPAKAQKTEGKKKKYNTYMMHTNSPMEMNLQSQVGSTSHSIDNSPQFLNKTQAFHNF